MKHLLIILSFLFLSSPLFGQKSSLEDKEMTPLEGVLYRSPKGGWTQNKEDNSDRIFEGKIRDGIPHGKGTTTLFNGLKMVGEFKKGRPWNTKFFNRRGKIIGTWVKGVKKSPKVIEAPAPKAVTVEAPPAPKAVTVEASLTNGQETLNLKLYVHIMRDITMNVKGVRMSNGHISKDTIEDKVMPELNKIWDQANIKWDLIEVYDENVVKKGYKNIPDGYPKSFEKLKNIIETSTREEISKNHKKIKIALISFTQLENRIKQNELGKNKYHIYVYPFIGNTLQGTVYDRSVDGLYFGILTVIGTWTNKYTKGGPPIKHKIVEDWDKWTKIKRGSLSRTIAHELGHVLFLKHHQCEGNCLMGPAKGKGRQGYKLTKRQIEISRKIAKKRLLRKD